MLQIVAMILFCDMLFFELLGAYVSLHNNVDGLHFLRKMRWLVFILFPWFAVLLWLVAPAEKLYRNSKRLYYLGIVLLIAIGVTLMIIGTAISDDGIRSCGLLLCLWTWLEDVLVKRHRDGGGGKPDDPEQGPDDPMPNGDAADTWLRHLHRQPASR